MNNKLRTLESAIFVRLAIIFIMLVILLFSLNSSISSVRATKDQTALLNEQNIALAAALSGHHEWSKNLLACFTLGTEFTGATNPDTCSLGSFVNSSDVLGNSFYSDFVSVAVPAHVRLHENGVTIVAYGTGNQTAAHALYESQILVDIATIVSAIGTQEKKIQEELSNLNTLLETEINRTLIIAFVCGFVIISLVVGTYMFLRVKVAQPMKSLASETQKLALGQLDLVFDKSSNLSEVSLLSTSLSTSVSELQRMISEIDKTMTEVSGKNYTVYPSMTFPGAFQSIETSMASMIDGIRSTFQEITITTSQVKTACEQFAMSAQLLSDGSTEQSASVEKITEAVSEISETMEENVIEARSANQTGEETAVTLENSVTQMMGILKAMEEIQKTTADVNNVIKTIHDIASQTNILALNAAVEAARAGTAGRGFAVVAEEVRNLSTRTSTAVQETTMLIEETVRAVKIGSDLVEQSAKGLQEVISFVNSYMGALEEITLSSEEQTEAITQISDGVQEITAVLQTNSAISEQSAATSEELASQATVMQTTIGQFKTHSDD